MPTNTRSLSERSALICPHPSRLQHGSTVGDPAWMRLSATRRDGRETHYRAIPEGLTPLFDWLKFFAIFWQSRFNQLEDLLKRMDQ